MPAKAGKDLLIRIKNDATPTPAFVAVAGLRTKSMTLNSEIIDTTNSDSTGLWRTVLEGTGVRSMQVQGSGVADTKTSLAVFQDMFFDQTHRDTEIVVPNVGTFAGKFRLTTFELSGEYNAAGMFSGTLESDGVITFTAEA